MPTPIPTVTKAVAVKAGHGQIFFHKHARNADQTAVRVRVSGRCKVWKTRPKEFRLPVKYGLYQSLAITDQTCDDFLTADPTDHK